MTEIPLHTILFKIFSLAVYNAAMLLYYTAALLAAPFSAKAKDWIAGRKNTQTLLRNFKLPENKNRVWFHCSSLGEFEQARPLIDKLKNELPHAFVVVTFFSPSGYNIRKNFALADVVCYLPLDTKSNAQQFIHAFQPTLVFWTKYDFYYHFLNLLHQQNIPLVLFSARFLPNQIFFKPYGKLFREMLQCCSKIFVQDVNSQQLLSTIHIESEQANDTRFDRVIAIAQQHKQFTEIESFIAGRKVVVCGSTWQPDEALLCNIINNNLLENMAWIIAPHNIDAANIQNLQQQLSGKCVLLSKLQEGFTAEVLIIDNIGMLSSLYAVADVAYIGGGFGASVHNVLEAAVFGKPLVFGTNYHKSFECVDLIHHHAAFSISNADELLFKLKELLHQNKAVKTGEIARNYVLRGAGGTDKIYTFAKEHLTA